MCMVDTHRRCLDEGRLAIRPIMFPFLARSLELYPIVPITSGRYHPQTEPATSFAKDLASRLLIVIPKHPFLKEP